MRRCTVLFFACLVVVALVQQARANNVGDFNGDGNADVLLRHDDGRWRIYAMSGRRAQAASGLVEGLPRDVAWGLAGVGDFNGDGRADALLRHVDGHWRVFAMDGLDVLTSESGDVALEADPAWRPAGVGDLDGNGSDDVLLRHGDTGGGCTTRWQAARSSPGGAART